jgi:hypothetical protein
MKFDILANSILNETAKGKKKLVKDKKTGEMYDPDEEFDKLMNKPTTLAMLKRMKNEEGVGWPKREK